MYRDIEDIRLDRGKKLDHGKKRIYFIDLNKDSILAPKTKNIGGKSDLAMLTNEQAVLESVYNILMTEPGERVMDVHFGVYLERYLFEPLDSITGSNIMREIFESLTRLDNRLENLEVVVTPDPELNSFIVDIYFAINNNEQVKFNTTLEKLR